jgi:uncharacterized protein
VVCHGDGLILLTKEKSVHADKVQLLTKEGVCFAACENTMKKKAVGKGDLLEGVRTVPSGAVELIQKQQQGCSYFRP